jgi:hypothetical protein
MNPRRYRRHRRLSGIVSLFDLARRVWPPSPATPGRPASARLGRDLGIPEREDGPGPGPVPHRRT